MTKGRHVASGGSGMEFQEHADASSPMRGAVLLLVAVVIGIAVLNSVDRSPYAPIVKGEHILAKNKTATTTSTTAQPSHLAQDVKVLVANGTKVQGAGSRVSDRLKQAGYNVLSPTTISVTDAIPMSAVYFNSSYDREAAAVAQAAQIGQGEVKAAPSPVADPTDADVVVVIGTDLAGSAPTTVKPTTTTAKPTSTTAKATSTTVKRSTTTTTTK